jgi:hypothetical protein
MQWEDAVLERLDAFVEAIVFSWYSSCTGCSSVSRDSPMINVVSHLDLCDLCSLTAVVSPVQLESMKVVSQIIHAIVEAMEKKGGAALGDFSSLEMTRPKLGSVFALEFSGRVKKTEEGLFNPGVRKKKKKKF